MYVNLAHGSTSIRVSLHLRHSVYCATRIALTVCGALLVLLLTNHSNWFFSGCHWTPNTGNECLASTVDTYGTPFLSVEVDNTWKKSLYESVSWLGSTHLLWWLYAGNGNDQNFQGGYFRKIFGQGGILPEVSNFDRKSRFLRLLEEYIISLDPPPQPQTHRAAAHRALAHGPQPREPYPMGPQPRELQPR